MITNETSRLIRHLQAQVRAKRFQLSRLHLVLERGKSGDDAQSIKPASGQIVLTQVEQIQKEITKLETRIQKLYREGTHGEEQSGDEPEMSPLELLGLTFLLREDGKIDEAQFSQIVKRVRGLMSKEA